MKAPDKIYLNAPKIQPELDNTTWDTKTYDDCENIEYLRKDALLEWAKKEKQFAGQFPTEYMRGQCVVLEHIIDKLNTL